MPAPLIPLIIAGGAAIAAGAGTAGAASASQESSGTRYWETPEERYNDMNAIRAGLPQPMYGGYNEGAHDMSLLGQYGMQASQGNANWAQGQAQGAHSRGPQAIENQELSNREAFTAGYDQDGSIQLAREAAMGQSPSEAAFLMQRGLDQGVAAQQSAAGSARGAAGIAMAQGNAGGNIANLQQQAFTQAGAMRAKEMGDARGLYNQAANAQRGQDQNRLQLGNQQSQFNAQQNDTYALGQANAANTASATANQWLGTAGRPYEANLQAGTANNATVANSYDAGQQRALTSYGDKNRADAASTDRLYGLAGGLINVGGSMMGAGMKGK